MANSMLGWVVGGSDGAPRHSGTNIGKVVTIMDKNRQSHRVVLFAVETAFIAAQDAYQGLIPHGQKPTAGWGQPGTKTYSALHHAQRRVGRQAQVHLRHNKISGVPIEVSVLLNDGQRPEESDR